MDNMFGAMPEFFKSEEELRKIWSNLCDSQGVSREDRRNWIWQGRIGNASK